MNPDVDELYQEVILDHYKNPRGRGPVGPAAVSCSLFNPLCGDQVNVSLDVCGAAPGECRPGFVGHGCSISQAAASMMTEACAGKSPAEAREVCRRFRALMRGETGGDTTALGDALALEGVRRFSARVKCAVLAWEAMEKCLDQYEEQTLAESARKSGTDPEPPPGR